MHNTLLVLLALIHIPIINVKPEWRMETAIASPASVWEEEEGSSWAGWPKGRAGRRGCLADRVKNWEIFPFRIKIIFLNLPRLWKFCTRRFRRNLDVGIFLSSSRLLKDFRKI
jgi:hypothetical protein